jgi:hypothetical protein
MPVFITARGLPGQLLPESRLREFCFALEARYGQVRFAASELEKQIDALAGHAAGELRREVAKLQARYDVGLTFHLSRAHAIPEFAICSARQPDPQPFDAKGPLAAAVREVFGNARESNGRSKARRRLLTSDELREKLADRQLLGAQRELEDLVAQVGAFTIGRTA